MPQEPIQPELDPTVAPFSARSRALLGGILAIVLVLLWLLLT